MKTGLGRGLDVLLGQNGPATVAAPTAPPPAGVTEIPLEKIAVNPEQPRKQFVEADLEKLAASIRVHGVLQPIVVSRRDGGYELIAGHRRVLASRLAEKTSIPAVIRDDASERLALALVENIQRADLNAMEEAHAYRSLVQQHGMTHQEIADRMGKSRETISNTVRLLEASRELQDAVVEGEVSEAHAKALLGLPVPMQASALSTVIARHLSAHATEALVRELASGKQQREKRTRSVDPDIKALNTELRAALGTKVEVEKKRRGGRITIEFYSNEEFERLYELLTRGAK